MRSLERQIGTIAPQGDATHRRAVATRRSSSTSRTCASSSVGCASVPEDATRAPIPGLATGLAVTGAGGDVLTIEVTGMEGEPGLHVTGQLGEVMSESAQIALSFVRAHADELGVTPDKFEHKRFHLHVPAGAVPKDGPSAGITMTTALGELADGSRGEARRRHDR